jgi:hypothetical protein
MPEIGPHPGLSKIRSVPLFHAERVEVVRVNTGRLREVMDQADVMSEGSVRHEGEKLVYYGSSSLRLPFELRHGESIDRVLARMKRDPHVRLMALRLARRELTARVVGRIGTMQAEIDIGLRANAVEVHVDVVAEIDQRRVETTSAHA